VARSVNALFTTLRQRGLIWITGNPAGIRRSDDESWKDAGRIGHRETLRAGEESAKDFDINRPVRRDQLRIGKE